MRSVTAEPPDALEAEVRRFQAGDPEALAGLADRLGPSLARFLGHLVPDAAQAQDLLQNLWLKAWTHREALQDPAKFRSWLYRIAHREFLMHLRGKAGAAQEEEMDAFPGGGESPADVLVREEDAGRMMEAFHALPPFQKEVVWLSVVEGLSHAQIARILDVPEGTCRSRLYNGLARMKKDLGTP